MSKEFVDTNEDWYDEELERKSIRKKRLKNRNKKDRSQLKEKNFEKCPSKRKRTRFSNVEIDWDMLEELEEKFEDEQD